MTPRVFFLLFPHRSCLCAVSVQSVFPPFHDHITFHIIVLFHPGDMAMCANPAADAAMLQRSFNKCVVTARFKLWWFAAPCAAQNLTLQCALQSTSPQQTWFNHTESHFKSEVSAKFSITHIKKLDSTLRWNTHLGPSCRYCVLLWCYWHVMCLNVSLSEWDSGVVTCRFSLELITLLSFINTAHSTKPFLH